jgi:hypothetical protein
LGDLSAGGAKLSPQKVFNNKQLSDNEFSCMEMLLKSSFKQRRAWLLVLILLALFCRAASAQLIMVSNYPTFLDALNTSSVITNFMTNSSINLTTGGQRININKSVLIDGGTNGIVFNGNGLARIFTVATNVQLTLANLQLINGTSTNGGAIYNNGTLVISNCIIAGNSATNITGATGVSSVNGNGGNGSAGGSAEGGAIYSRGPMSIYFSVVGTNSALGGNGGSGGSGGNSLEFGGNGGDAGGGGSAFGAAVFCSGSNNVFVSSQFFNNTCTAGSAGSGGAGGTGAFASYGGAGAAGGSAAGGAVYVTGKGRVFVTNCLFAQNTIAAGASGTDGSGKNNGFNGGYAEGGGLYVAATVPSAYLENSVFFQNSCTGGAGGSATAGSENGGNGGSAVGGGLASAAALTIVRNCTLATNSLAGGAAGTGTSANGSIGLKGGWDVGRIAGVVRLSGSILSGGTNVAPNTMPNAVGVTDAGYNISSDASLVRAFGDTTLLNSTNIFLDTGLANYGGPPLGPANLLDPVDFLTLAIVDGSVATNFVPGVPGLSFPATDELGNARGSPTSAGDYEPNPITIDSNALPPSVQIDTPLTNQVVDIGGAATFTVEVTGNYDANNNPIGFQWQHNGTNLTDNNNFIGSATSSLTITNVTTDDQGLYQVVVGVSVLESLTTVSGFTLTNKIPAKITTQPASKTDVPEGSVVTFSVGATGSPPLAFQWYWVTTDLVTNMLTDANEFSGATTSTLTINPATAMDDGSYFVMVTNDYKLNTSADGVLKIVPDVTKPTIKISLPAAGTRTNNLVVTGSATDNAQVTNVYYWVTNINAGNSPSTTTNSGVASLGTNGTTTKTWAITNAFLPGTNYVTVQCVNYSGNRSAFATREFFYDSPAMFTLITNGPGTVNISPSLAGEFHAVGGIKLNIGQGYTLTAVPAKNNVLSNWVVSAAGKRQPGSKPQYYTSDSVILHFIMEPDLTVTANFNTNYFLVAEGTYNGLFYQTNAVTEQTAGMLKNLKIGPTGTYSGTLLLGGGTFNLANSFNTSGYASNYVKRTALQGGPLAVEMTLDWASGEIMGSVSNLVSDGWVSSLEAEKSAVAPISAEYTALLAPGTNAVGEIPPGFGYMLITNHNGTVILSGALADGTSFNEAPPMGVMGDIPVYANLYGNTGLLLGWLGLAGGIVGVETPMAWIKPAARTGIYTEGFTNYLLVSGSGWTNSMTRAFPVSFSQVPLTITNANLDLGFTISMTNNTVGKTSGTATSPTNSLTGTFSPKTGLLTITFGDGIGKGTTIGYAAILPGQQHGGGYFVTKTNAGALLLNP